jgi:UDP-N-acetyl-D-glucosamine dehydrogenase
LRPTHNNMLFPGPGIGGYCLPKDGGLGLWAYKHIHGWSDDIFRLTAAAIDINDTRGLHAAELVRDTLRDMHRPMAMAKVLLCGASYREDVGDTRYSGSELIARKLTEMGADIRVHDPYVDQWWEFVTQDNYPASGRSLKRFFRNQDKLKNLQVQKDLGEALAGCDAVVFAVRHGPYLDLSPDEVVRAAGGPLAVVDCFCLLDDRKIQRYFELGCEVRGLGRGHVRRIKEGLSS